MFLWKMYLITFIEIISFLIIGFLLTDNVLKNVYESARISFTGNVWVVWFGLSFMLFGIYTIVLSFFVSKENRLLKDRLTSKTFWLIVIASFFGVFVPFFIGEIPF
ncbi:hypothetical protein GCM10009865_05440 [Aeromicrobium ponti]|uniref:Uncharacterized protein n=1 Tax=Cytobacillus oceanisediminis TaxID=665099 RepID=A0A562K6D2_9BACI|nr:hypothetical protein [Cytobacillus oceanisediminis]TWH91001.1 hypothetical protein IQ19_00451 [Cytobacillus oceanisediminis]